MLFSWGGIVRIPKDIPLYAYIMQLIRADRLAEFYQSEEWKELRQEVLDEYHNECVMCLAHGKYTRADCVHHVNEVRKRPELALSKYFIDKDGRKQRQLIPLCNTCHNIIHDKLGNWQKQGKFSNEERW